MLTEKIIMKIKALVTAAILFLSPAFAHAEILTLEAAIDSALHNNFDVNISRKSLESAKINNTPGNAGKLPTVTMNGGALFQKNFGSDISNDLNSRINAGVSAFWNLYDGGRKQLNETVLKENVNGADLSLRNSIIETIYNVCAAYYQIVRLYQNLEVTHNLMSYDSTLEHIAEIAFESGDKSKTDLLLARIDYNSARQTEIEQYTNIHMAKVGLNEFMASETIGFDYTVDNNFNVQMSLPDSTEIRKKIAEENPQISEIDKRIELAGYAYEINNTGLKPTISLAGGYNFYEDYMHDSKSNHGSKSHNFSFSHGPQFEADFSMPLYDAGETARKANTAKIEQESLSIEKDKLLDELYDSFEQAYAQYRDRLKILEIEWETFKMAKENLDLNIELFREGETTVIEVRQARTELISSSSRLTDDQYYLKLAELKLRLLTGNL